MQAGFVSALALLAAALVLVAAGRAGGAQPVVQTLMPSCPGSRLQGSYDFHDLTLVKCNFSGLNLTAANFRGATLTAVVFVRAKLVGADFSGATFVDSGNPVFPNDFTLANLSQAKFKGARFNGLTYLSHATLTSADFSDTDVSSGNAVFGEVLDFDAGASPRLSFAGTKMNCEFVAQWNLLDMSNANIGACTDQLQTVRGKAHDFSGGVYSNVVFDNLDLSGSKWNGAVLDYASFQGATLDNATGLNGTANALTQLSAAKFNNASVQNVDLSYARLYGAQFTKANLSNSSFAGSVLQANTSVTPPIETAAVFDGAHLRNVSFASAKLQSVSFRFASLYGPHATAAGATLTGADFSNAYLYGVDFGGKSTINGTNFGSAILVAANFASAKFQVDGGAAPDFNKALLQGATFDTDADLVNSVLLNAFVDFGKASNPFAGNAVYLLLTTDYTGFRGWTGSKRPCVELSYPSFTVVPPNASMTCPSGNLKICGAGDTPASLANWKSAIAMVNNSVPGWYELDATYDDATAKSAICNNNATVDPKW